MKENNGQTPPAAAGRRRLFIFSLWYFPSHFGLHVVDIAAAFSRAGYDVTIVTVAAATFNLPYFDAFRELFDVVASGWPHLVRLNVERLEERGAYNPCVVIRRDSTFHDCMEQVRMAPCHLLHFFEMLVPYFNAETVTSSLSTSVLYAGNFVTRVTGQHRDNSAEPPSPETVVNTLLHPYSVDLAGGGYRLRGVDCIFSETHELVHMLRSTALRTPCRWTSRPVFAAPVLAAPPCDIHTTWSIPRTAKVLLYAGRPAKNARALLSILKLVRLRCAIAPIVLLLVGMREDPVAGWPGAHELRSSIRTAPFVSRATLFGIMKSADVFVYPGLVDGYPKVLTEANLARLPVVAFNSPASGVHEIAMDGETALLVHSASPVATTETENERFATAIARILTDPALRGALVERAFLTAMDMDAPDFVTKLEELWRRSHEARASQNDTIPDRT
ncbi:MAG: glycosyltransferase family 4 protein [Acetobacteraceae bacterium]